MFLSAKEAFYKSYSDVIESALIESPATEQVKSLDLKVVYDGVLKIANSDTVLHKVKKFESPLVGHYLRWDPQQEWISKAMEAANQNDANTLDSLLNTAELEGLNLNDCLEHQLITTTILEVARSNFKAAILECFLSHKIGVDRENELIQSDLRDFKNNLCSKINSGKFDTSPDDIVMTLVNILQFNKEEPIALDLINAFNEMAPLINVYREKYNEPAALLPETKNVK